MPATTAYKTKAFERLVRKEDIEEESFHRTIIEILSSNHGSLGHKLYKKRIGSRFGGKRGSYRAIVYYKMDTRIIFLHLYAKNENSDLNPSEMKGFIMISRDLDRLTENDIKRLVEQHELVRYNYETEILANGHGINP
jgi:hypothetical protein